MDFYDLNIKGKNFNHDLELIKEAKRLGWNYLTLRFSPDRFDNIDYKDDLIKKIAIFNDFSIDFGIETNPKNNNELRKVLQKYRSKSPLFSVLGGNEKINRITCENIKVDILSRPYFKRYDCGMNHILAKIAYQNDVAIELSLKDILNSYLSHRARIISHFRDIIKLYRKFKFPLIISSGASSIFDIRSPRDIIAIFKEIGLNEEEIISCFNSYPKEIIDFNKERKNIIVPGVKKIK